MDFVELKDGTLRYWPFAILVGIVFAAEIVMASVFGVHSLPDAFDAAPGADTNAGRALEGSLDCMNKM